MHCRVGLMPMRRPSNAEATAADGKKRVPVPATPVNRTRSPKDGLPRMLNERPPDVRALSPEGSFRQGGRCPLG